MNKIKKFLVWLKSLPIGLTGLVAFIGIMLLLTAIFNWFWTGLGTDPTRTFYAPFTTNFNDFKEYAALYIPLISFGATLFAGFVVFLVFNDWKEQHNKNVYSEYALRLLKEYENIFFSMLSIDKPYVITKNKVDKIDLDYFLLEGEKQKAIIKKYSELDLEFREKLDEIEANIEDLLKKSSIFSALTNNSNLLLIAQKIQNEIKVITNEIRENSKKTMTTDEFDAAMKQYGDDIKNIVLENLLQTLNILKKHIEA